MQNKKYIFIICPNNSGSTLLYRRLGECKKAVKLSNEGQLIYGIGNGPINDKGICKGKYFSECQDIYENTENYKWDRIKKIWMNDWTKNKKDANIFIEKSPQMYLKWIY